MARIAKDMTDYSNAIRSQAEIDLHKVDPLLDSARRAADGDNAAAMDLFDAMSGRLLRAATLILQDRHLAEDALQESLLASIQHAHRFNGNVPFDAWVYRILVNTCRSFQRSARWRRWLPLGEVPPNASASGGPQASRNEDRYVKAALVSLDLQDALRQLSVEDRTALVLHYYEDRPIAEIASILNVRVGTVKSRLHRSRRRLAALLKGESK